MAGQKTERPLTARAKKVVDFIEQAFWEHGGLPDNSIVAKAVGENESYVKNVLEKNYKARHALAARGVDLEPDRSAQLLTSQQLMAANVVLNSHDKRSLREKLDFLGISSQQWSAWLRKPAFSQYLTKRAEAAFSGNDFQAYQALENAVEEGDMNAVKFHFEMRGKYKNTLDVNVNIESVLTTVVEIVAKHVKDPDTIIRIAEDLEGVQAEVTNQAPSPVAAAITEGNGNVTQNVSGF